MRDTYAIIQSPAYESQITQTPRLVTCTWTVTVPNTTRILLAFPVEKEFKLNPGDSLKVRVVPRLLVCVTLVFVLNLLIT